MTDSLNYPALIDNAMRGVVRDVLKRVQQSGLPGEHHFYISYSTTHPGVRMSEQLRAKYPHEITIVLQHQFWDFKVEEHQFGVTLSFGGVPEKLVVPFAALSAFADPSIKFGLQFQPSELFDVELVEPEDRFEDEPAATREDTDAEPAEKIISLDAFRKK
jgi:uncharacterized protein